MNTRWIIVGLTLAAGWPAPAQQTNAAAATDFSAFRVISQRNIFDPTRTARRRDNGRTSSARSQTADAFSLVGIMSYGKGDFAFFDGTHPDYRKILEPSGQIAGYTVTEITPSTVKLTNEQRLVEMRVGTQLRHDEQNGWQLVASAELPTTSPATENAAAPAPTSNAGTDEPNEVLRRLMQQREQELK